MEGKGTGLDVVGPGFRGAGSRPYNNIAKPRAAQTYYREVVGLDSGEVFKVSTTWLLFT